VSVPYDERTKILPGIEIRLRDAGHILGAAIVEVWLEDGGRRRKLVFSGDLGHADAPVMNDPTPVPDGDVVLMESTYGDRDHRPFDRTLEELRGIFLEATEGGGNILIPAFAVGRTQDLLYLMARHFDDWGLAGLQVFLDSPMAIETTQVYSRYRHLYRTALFGAGQAWPELPNLRPTKRSAESMEINRIEAGAIVIAGSGMCSGGRILHHLKHNLWRPECHVVMIGYQAEGTLGRRLVDGAPRVRLWQETIQVRARIHTVGGLSAHAGQSGLLNWYGAFKDRPPVWLVHGEQRARSALSKRLADDFGAEAHLPRIGDVIDLAAMPDRVGPR
jgi:metallo-beta-lactamase family protein